MTSSAWADVGELVIRVDGYDSWSSAVAALQSDVGAEGRALRVRVHRAGGGDVACGGYSLVLDAVSAQAFASEGCDPATGATVVRLVRRAALFDHDDDVSHPRIAGIAAVEELTGAAAGGAPDRGGSELVCSVAVRPFRIDLEHGARVYLVPGRFVLRPIEASVTVDADASGWTLHGRSSAALVVEYDVFDTARGTVAVHDRATLRCASETVPDAAVATPRTEPLAPRPPRQARFAVEGAVTAGAGFIPLSELSLHGTLGTFNGSRLGLDSAWFGTVGLELSAELPWVYAAVAGEYWSGDSLNGGELRVSAAGAVRSGAALIYLGPALRLWALRRTFFDGTPDLTYSTDLNTSVALELGLRIRHQAAWNAGRSWAGVGDIAIHVTAPVSGEGAWLLGVGFGWGVGL